MNGDVTVRVENLAKVYRIGVAEKRHESLAGALATAVRSPLQNLRTLRRLSRFDDGETAKAMASSTSAGGNGSDVYWALRDVSFEVRRGEAIGIIGRNGSGKSTLLKILSRITEPTAGRATIHGRVASLLEVGTGFHPDLTGRENVYLNGTILGMRKREIDAKFDEIAAFSGVETFLDTPVKRYSSGMRVRLAFSVAAHLDPDVLIIDEVLAVGDAEFQKKCLGKMEHVRGEGRAVLLVSHDMNSVSVLTSECLLLHQGACVARGPTRDVIRKYLEGGAPSEQVFRAAPRNDAPSVTAVEVLTSEPNGVQSNGRPLRLAFEVHSPTTLRSAGFSFQIIDAMGRPVIHAWRFESEWPLLRQAGTHRMTCIFPKLRLYMGRYSLTTHLAEAQGGKHFETRENVCSFEVAMLFQQRDWSWRPGDCQYLEDVEWSADPIETQALPGGHS